MVVNLKPFDVIMFVIIWKIFRTISKSQLVNTVNVMETVVEIEFSITISRKYKIVRGIKLNIFEIWIKMIRC